MPEPIQINWQKNGVKELQEFVGISYLPNQIHAKSLITGFNLTMMIAGESGVGKASAVNCLFNSQLIPPSNHESILKNIELKTISGDVTEGSVSLKLNVINVQGYGDLLNNEKNWKIVQNELQERHFSYFMSEANSRRTKVDDRVHVLVYFIAPNAHGMKPFDVEFLKNLQYLVNLVPVITKADTLTTDELLECKKSILRQLDDNKISIFVPQIDNLDDAETVAEVKELIKRMPFAIVTGSEDVNVNGVLTRGRKYKWGSVANEDQEASDFLALRQLLIRNHLEELKDKTNDLYTKYRADNLANNREKISRIESEMNQVLNKKISEREEQLKKSESELLAKHDAMKEKLREQRASLKQKYDEIRARRIQLEAN